MKKYDLEERTFQFAKSVRLTLKTLKPTQFNQDDFRQLIRSSGSVGANYIEANEKLGEKDFLMRIKICRKEAKESEYWLRMIMECNSLPMDKKLGGLKQEALELKKIFSAIIRNRVSNRSN